MKKNYFFFLVMAGIAMLFMLASCKKAKVIEKPLQTAPQQAASQAETGGSGAPHPEAAAKLPAIERKNENILIVYKHTGFGYEESYGFDTYVFRLLADPAGQISGGIVYQRTNNGEVDAIHYNVIRSSNEITLAASGADKKSWSATLKLKDGSIAVSGQQKLLAKLDKALVFASTDGNYSESYSIDQAAPEMPSEIKKGGSTLEKGKWTFPEHDKAVYVQTKPDDTANTEGFQVSLWREENGDLRFRTEGPTPINEVYASGLAAVLAGDHALSNAVLLDLMLGESRYLRPVYAFAISRRGSGK